MQILILPTEIFKLCMFQKKNGLVLNAETPVPEKKLKYAVPKLKSKKPVQTLVVNLEPTNATPPHPKRHIHDVEKSDEPAPKRECLNDTNDENSGPISS